jgi:Protein of unknown function (DUF2933)
MSRFLSPWLALLGFLAIAAFFLVTEHRAHVFGAVPYLLLLACPLLHFFTHRNHGRHGSHDGGGGQPGRGDSAGVGTPPARHSHE